MAEDETNNEYLYSFSFVNNSKRLRDEEVDKLGEFCLTYFGKSFYWINKSYAELEQNDKARFRRLTPYMNRFIEAHKRGNLDAALGWLHALSSVAGWAKSAVRLEKTASELAKDRPKAISKRRQESALPRAQPAGGESTKKKWASQEDRLRKEIYIYLDSNAALFEKGANACCRFLEHNKRLCDYKPSMAIKKIRLVFNEKKIQRESNK
ncbi:MAG: hypothetical protein Q8O33_07100 [Pseudomonadota bacterium]|nr:hypothetical protein [Pseudomonadota bacterium]